MRDENATISKHEDCSSVKLKLQAKCTNFQIITHNFTKYLF